MKALVSLVLAAGLGVSTALYAESEYYVVKFNTDDVYLFDDNGDDLAEISKTEAEQGFSQYTVNGESVTGIKVLAIDQGEGLVSIALPGQASPVWVELMSVQVWPDENKLDCGDMKIAESQSEVAQSGMTIGFGDHCK